MLFAAVTGLGLLSAPALAQDAARKIHPHQGSPLGEWLFSRRATINTHSSTALEHCCCCGNTNGQMGAIVLVKSTTAVNDQGPARLVLERSGDGWFVSSMVITDIGEELSFGAPSLRTEAAKKGSAAPPRSLPVPTRSRRC